MLFESNIFFPWCFHWLPSTEWAIVKGYIGHYGDLLLKNDLSACTNSYDVCILFVIPSHPFMFRPKHNRQHTNMPAISKCACRTEWTGQLRAYVEPILLSSSWHMIHVVCVCVFMCILVFDQSGSPCLAYFDQIVIHSTLCVKCSFVFIYLYCIHSIKANTQIHFHNNRQYKKTTVN